ncbi:T9SS type A sorting domain-containing protein [Mesonia sp. K7]|uniref:T9SS type A sorting domain-containing protein n=1 Tax=Mesonia sp. K7 TaxID=2218606 RepID=UPI000DA93D96|nr:T9SS type A sorting domain-containing protein [Mesonia sp. K7]PZD79216.1 hypothetical protein DNG35_01630 [Mesonia sp. K7]
MKKMKLFLLLMCCASMSMAQQYYSGSVFGGQGLDVVYDTAQDSEGNLYTVGLFQTSITVGGSTVNIVGGNADGFITKHDSNGNPLWVKSVGGNLDDVILGIAIDGEDNIYLTGYFQGAGSNAFDADPGSGVYTLEQLSPIASRDSFTIKLDSNADFVWAKQVSNPSGGAANEDTPTILVDDMGNVYIAGSFIYADFDPDPNSDEIQFANNNGANGPDAFLLKLNNNGEFVWVKTLPGSGFTKIIDMQFDANYNFYLTGQFEGSVDLDPSNTASSMHTSVGGYDIFSLKLDSNGDFVWGNSYGSITNDTPNTIHVGTSGVYVGGYFTGVTDFDPSSNTSSITPLGDADGFVNVLDTSGNYVYTYVVGGNDVGLEEVTAIKEHNNTVRVSGNFAGTVDFDNDNANTANSTALGGFDAYLLELDATGAYQDHVILGNSDNEDFTGFEINKDDQVLLIGSYQSNPIDLNPFSGTDNYNNVAVRDVYISRFTTQSLASTSQARVIQNFSLYPNPANHQVTIASDHTFTHYQLNDFTGRLIQEEPLSNNSIDVSTLPQGVYLLTLSSAEGNKMSKKLIKQ